MINFINFINNNLKWLALVGIAVIVLIMMRQCGKNKDMENELARIKVKNQIISGNVKVLQDTVKFWKDENGNSLSSISILTADKEMLKTEYRDLTKKYEKMVGKAGEDSKMIAYLSGQISFKDREIADLKSANSSEPGSRIINDSTIQVNVGKQYDSLNSYKVTGTVLANIRDNKITAGRIDLTTAVDMGIEIGLNRDNETKIARITTKTAFPAKVIIKGITQIEDEINKTPKSYLGLGTFIGYGATLAKQPTLTPILGVGIYYAPSWATIKFYKK